MKNVLLTLLIFICFAFNSDKGFKVELPLTKWQQHLNGLSYIGNTIVNSDLPARQVKFIQDSILNPLQEDIISQVRQQIDTTKKK